MYLSIKKTVKFFISLFVLVFYFDAAGFTKYSIFVTSMLFLLYLFYKYNKTYLSFMYALYISMLLLLPAFFISLNIGVEYSSYNSYSLYALVYIAIYVFITMASYQIIGLKASKYNPSIFNLYYPTRFDGIGFYKKKLMLLLFLSLIAKIYLNSLGQFRMLDDEQSSSIVSYLKVISQLDLFVMLAIGFHYKNGYHKELFIFYIFTSIVVISTGVLGGSRYSVIVVFIVIFFNHFHFFRTKMLLIAPLAIPIMMIFPILGLYRNSGYTLGIIESLELAMNNTDLIANVMGILLDRMNYLGVVSTVIEEFKYNSDYLFDYLDNFIAMVPRLAWPDKPIIGIDLNDLGIQLGILAPSNTNTSIGLTVIGESFYQLRNFGLIVAIFQGAMFGFLEKIKITESLVAYVYYFYAISLLLFLDSYAYFLPQLIQTSIFLFVFGYFFNKPMSRKDI